jgi:hypothetical protein
VRLVLPGERLGKDSTSVLAYYRQGTGMFEGCSYETSLNDLRVTARKVGARTVWVRQIFPPDENTSCYRMEALLFK